MSDEDDSFEMENLNKDEATQRSPRKHKASSVSKQLNIYKASSAKNKKKRQSCWKECNWFKWALVGQCLIIIALLVISNSSEKQYSEELDKQKSELDKANHLKNNQKADKQNSGQYGVTQVNEVSERKDSIKDDNQLMPIAKPSPIEELKIKPPWPSLRSDYDMSQQFNLWNLSPERKAQILGKFNSLPQNQRPEKKDNYMEINYGKDVGFLQYAQQYEKDIEVINWNKIELTEQDKKQLTEKYQKELEKRTQNLKKIYLKYQQQYHGKNGYINPKKKITYQQFLNNLEYQMLTGKDFKNDPLLEKVYEKEREYHQRVYRVNDRKEQLHACIIAPTYNNQVDYRYAWHLESIFQQEYKNYRMIIIDDKSTDKTSSLIARHLKWRNAPEQKVILIKGLKHRTALENIYYGVHKYCDYSQMSFIIDGDDEIVGTQVFKLYNALYQQKRSYVIWSNYFSYDSKNSTDPIVLGLSEEYPETVKRQVVYRYSYHAYSHLRTMMTDLFLLEKAQSLKDHNGKFYWTIYDNAMYFPALEMSCGRNQYVPEMKYWYTANTGINDWRTQRQSEYSFVKNHIARSQKHYHCINNVFKMMIAAIEPQTNT